MRSLGSLSALKSGRWRAVELLAQDLSVHELARHIGCHANSVMHWRDAVVQGGANAPLRSRKEPLLLPYLPSL